MSLNKQFSLRTSAPIGKLRQTMARLVKRNVGLHFSGAKSLSLSPAAPFEEIYKADRGA